MSLSETAKRILKLSEKSETIIGLRGETTKIYLDSIGVRNTQVIGCPSIFYKKVIPVKSNNIQKILVSGSFYGNWKEKIELLLKFGLNYNADYIIQSESRILLDKYFNENQIDFWNLEKERLEYLKSEDYDYKFYCHKDLTPVEIKKWLVNNYIFFNNFDEWKSSMNYDLSFGVRFHGSIMSTLNGVPTLILSGDARVDEFVKYHELPNIKLKLLEDNLKPEDIYDLIDYSEYSYKYEYLKNRYINFLKCNNLEFKDDKSR